MLAVWRECNVDKSLRKAWEQGIVLEGVSAGSICWFDQGVTDSIPGPLTSLNALGILPGSNCPHYDDEKERRPSYHQLMKDEKIGAGIAIDDFVAVHFIDDAIHKIIKINPYADAYQVYKDGNTIKEEKIEH